MEIAMEPIHKACVSADEEAPQGRLARPLARMPTPRMLKARAWRASKSTARAPRSPEQRCPSRAPKPARNVVNEEEESPPPPIYSRGRV